MNRAVGNIDNEFNWSGIAEEFAKVRAMLEAQDSDDPEHLMTSGAVRAAEAAVNKQDGSKLAEYLKIAGVGIGAIATKVGAPLLLAYLKDKFGFDLASVS